MMRHLTYIVTALAILASERALGQNPYQAQIDANHQRIRDASSAVAWRKAYDKTTRIAEDWEQKAANMGAYPYGGAPPQQWQQQPQGYYPQPQGYYPQPQAMPQQYQQPPQQYQQPPPQYWGPPQQQQWQQPQGYYPQPQAMPQQYQPPPQGYYPQQWSPQQQNWGPPPQAWQGPRPQPRLRHGPPGYRTQRMPLVRGPHGPRAVAPRPMRHPPMRGQMVRHRGAHRRSF